MGSRHSEIFFFGGGEGGVRDERARRDVPDIDHFIVVGTEDESFFTGHLAGHVIFTFGLDRRLGGAFQLAWGGPFSGVSEFFLFGQGFPFLEPVALVFDFLLVGTGDGFHRIGLRGGFLRVLNVWVAGCHQYTA